MMELRRAYFAFSVQIIFCGSVRSVDRIGACRLLQELIHCYRKIYLTCEFSKKSCPNRTIFDRLAAFQSSTILKTIIIKTIESQARGNKLQGSQELYPFVDED